MAFPDLELDEAQELVGRSFFVTLEEAESLQLELVEASPIQTQPGSAHGFSLLFTGPAKPVLTQATYLLSVDGADPQPVFLVPIGAGQESTSYEAVFTRLQ